MKMVYIASPYHADTAEEMDKNVEAALAACAEAYHLGRLTGIQIVPITPLVNFPYLNENDPAERNEALRLGLSLLMKCDELWCAGDRISEGMRGEIWAAVRLEMPVYSMGMAKDKIQAAIDNMKPMLNSDNCIAGSTDNDYTGELLILSESKLAPWAKEPESQLWIAQNGFGTSPDSSGRAVNAKCIFDGEVARWNREDFCGIADPDKLPDWAKEMLSEQQNNFESEELEQ